jgi:hypothetical protein
LLPSRRLLLAIAVELFAIIRRRRFGGARIAIPGVLVTS